MGLPKISIITPSYNQVEFLEQTIKSVLEQEYANLEYIIIDGGSTDGSVDIIKKYAHQLTYWISEPDTGLYNALNKGFKIATGDILAWLNSDDIYFNKSLFMVAEIFNNFSKVNWLTSNHTFINDEDVIVHTHTSKCYSRLGFLRDGIKWIQQESTFWRRSLWEKSGGNIDENCSLAGDYELWCRMYQFDVPYLITTSLAGFRVHRHGQLSQDNLPEYMMQVDSIREKYHELLNEDVEYRGLKKLEYLMKKIPLSKFLLQNRHRRLKDKLLWSPANIAFDRKAYKFK